MKTLSLEKMEKVEGGGCGFWGSVVLGFWATGVGAAFGAVTAGVGVAVGLAATVVVAAVCELT